MARPMKPLVRGDGYYPSNKWTPLVYPGGYTTMNGGEEPEPPTPVYWKTITGVSPLVLAKALQEHIRSLTQYGKCVQDGTPTPSAPVDILCNNGVLRYSANMANVNEQTARVGYYINAQGAVLADSYNWFYQSFVPVNPNTTYTLSMSTPVYYVTISEYSTAEDSGFVIRKNGTTGSNSSLTITTSANTNFIRFGANINRGPITLETVFAIKWMLNLGGTAMPYQPYVEGGIYTDGTPEVLTVSGKNLLDPSTSNITIGQIVNANGEIVTSANNWRTDYIPVEGGKTYAFWGRTKADNAISAYNRINWYTADKTAITPRPGYTINTVTVGTAPSNAAYAMLCCAPITSSNPITRATFDLYNWMFAGASAEVPYQPYAQPQTATDIPMLLGVGNYKDEAELINGIKTGKIGVKVLNGTETWEKGVLPSANYYYGGDTILKSNAEDELLCNQFVAGTRNVPAIGKICVRSARNGFLITPNDQTIDTADKFKQFLAAQYAAGTPVIVLYPLATETTEQGTPHSLHTSEGDNVVSVVSNVDPVTLSVEYASSEE